MITTALIFLNLVAHPFHVSVMEIKFKEEKKAIQISTRIFLDDLEEALKASSGNDTLDITSPEDWDFVKENLEAYVLQHVRISSEKSPLLLNYIGAEIEDDVMWVYVEIEKVRKLQTVKVWNSLLTEVFDDQENIVHFRAYDKVKSERLYKGEEEKVFNWE